MISACLLLASALSAGNAEFDRTAAEGAAHITMDRFVRELRVKGPGAGVLSSEMLRDPGAFSSRTAAVERCRGIYIGKAEEAFSRKLAEVRRKLSLGDSFVRELTGKDRSALEAAFPRAFEEERRSAVETQAKNIVAATRPGEAEFEEKPEEVLRREMTARVVAEQKSPVFEENLSYISSKMVDPVIAGAREERKRQHEYLMRARSDAFAPSRLRKELEERVKANVRQRSKDVPAEEAWGVFPSVLSKGLDSAVERRSVNRLKSCMDDVKLEVRTSDVAAVIASDPDAHVRYSASEKVFSAVYSRQVLSNALASAVSAALPAERAEFRDFLVSRMGGHEVGKAVEKVVRREIMPKWKAARAEVAAESAKSVWPTLEDGTWYPDPVLADDTLSRSDYGKAVRSWRGLEGLEGLASAPGGKSVMEESARLADERVAAAFELARTAIAAQNKIVDSSHGSVLEEAKSRKEGVFSKAPDLDGVIAMLTAVTEAKWNDTRLSVLWPDGGAPANAEEQHVSLFPSVKRKIELLARKILEELEVPEPDEPQPEDPEQTDSDSSSEEMKTEFTVSVLKTPSGVEVKLLKGDTPVVERTVKAKFAPFDKAMKDVSEKLGRDLLALP